jgi:hypothetical protein
LTLIILKRPWSFILLNLRFLSVIVSPNPSFVISLFSSDIVTITIMIMVAKVFDSLEGAIVFTYSAIRRRISAMDFCFLTLNGVPPAAIPSKVPPSTAELSF